MKKSFMPFSNYLDNSIDDDFSSVNFPLFSASINNSNYCQTDVFNRKNSQFSDYDEGNEKDTIIKKSKKSKINLQNLEFDFTKKFNLFNKGTNNPYVNEVIK